MDVPNNDITLLRDALMSLETSTIEISIIEIRPTQVDQNGLVYGLFIDGKRCQNVEITPNISDIETTLAMDLTDNEMEPETTMML
ncbi:unnamed protein product [Rotaria magnacalcarata]|uniref:Uncharacterized protein n=1 Tax=Rotaria magnacalcarata TaxID=392030 RepID=A0A820PD45_9BILA|nr:unnamed protein product [Rotaria magnacalcarata]